MRRFSSRISLRFAFSGSSRNTIENGAIGFCRRSQTMLIDWSALPSVPSRDSRRAGSAHEMSTATATSDDESPGLNKNSFGWPRCTGPSTNASCQPEKRENWYEETWGSASTLGLSLHPRTVSFPTGETARRASTCRMWRIRATVAAGAPVKITGVGFGTRTVWLPGMDSNHDSRLQRPLSYH